MTGGIGMNLATQVIEVQRLQTAIPDTTPTEIDTEVISSDVHGLCDLVSLGPKPLRSALNPRDQIDGVTEAIRVDEVIGFQGFRFTRVEEEPLASRGANSFKDSEVLRSDLNCSFHHSDQSRVNTN